MNLDFDENTNAECCSECGHVKSIHGPNGCSANGILPERDCRCKTNLNDYQKLASRTAVKGNRAELVIGLVEEAGEVAGCLKKALFHGHTVDNDKLTKELGDVLWYLSSIALEYGIELEEVAAKNIEKLRKRYPNGFTENDSINRDVDK